MKLKELGNEMKIIFLAFFVILWLFIFAIMILFSFDLIFSIIFATFYTLWNIFFVVVVPDTKGKKNGKEKTE